MPVLHDLEVLPGVEEITRLWGPQRNRRLAGRSVDVLVSLLEEIQTGGWLQPAISYGIRNVISRSKNGLLLEGGILFSSRVLRHQLQHASCIAGGVCTLGGTLQRETERLFAAGEPLRAVLLDEIGTLALFRLSDRMETILQDRAREAGLGVGAPLSPGEGGFDIREQRTVLKLANGAAVDASLTPAGMLNPGKSLSLLVGMGKRMTAGEYGDRCRHCRARDRCPYRRDARSSLAA